MLKTIKCKNCGASSYKKISDDTYECKYCGMQVRKKNVKCDECEKEISDFNESVSVEESVDKNIDLKFKRKKSFTLVKLMLCIFCGYLGIHRFLEGKIFTGIIYFFTYGLFGFGTICDIIRLVKELGMDNFEDKK